MKKILIGIFIVVIAVAALFLILFHPSVPAPSNLNAVSLPTSSNELSPVYQISALPTITLGTLHGSVTIDNFYKTALGAEDEFIVIARNNDYEINYDTSGSGFYIDIKQAPFNTNRASAEKDFLNLLGVDQIDACKLSVAVGAEPAADGNLNGGMLPLSFCAQEPF